MRKKSIAITGMVILLTVLLLSGCGGNNITLEQFDSIEVGMSYDEVAEILGRPGELAFERDGFAHVYHVYHWQFRSPQG